MHEMIGLEGFYNHWLVQLLFALNCRICSQSFCPYLAEASSDGYLIVSGNVTTGVKQTEMFAAIDATSLSSYINLEENDVGSNCLSSACILYHDLFVPLTAFSDHCVTQRLRSSSIPEAGESARPSIPST